MAAFPDASPESGRAAFGRLLPLCGHVGHELAAGAIPKPDIPYSPISVIRVARSASRKRTSPADNEMAVTGGKRTFLRP
jgi:hypothetical protein